MKKLLFLILFTSLVAIILSCGNGTSNSKANSQPGNEQTDKKDDTAKGPAGTYSTVENGKPMQFVINADGTGFENYQGTKKRPFTWKSKDGKIFFTYDGEGQEWELPIDIAKGEISYGSLVYKME